MKTLHTTSSFFSGETRPEYPGCVRPIITLKRADSKLTVRQNPLADRVGGPAPPLRCKLLLRRSLLPSSPPRKENAHSERERRSRESRCHGGPAHPIHFQERKCSCP